MIGSIAVLGTVLVGTSTPAQADWPPGVECWQSGCIRDWAYYESKRTDRNTERGGNNCNYYSGFWGNSGDDVCGVISGTRWRSNEWCADFARYTWYKAGANVSGLDAWAGSFYRANRSNGSYHSKGSGYVPKAGDAVLFDWDGTTPALNDGWDVDHVGIVDGYATGWVNSFEGNTSGGGSRDGVYFKGRNTSRVVGYVSARF